MIRNSAWWVFASMVAIAIVESNALLGVAVAIAGGVVLGILLTR